MSTTKKNNDDNNENIAMESVEQQNAENIVKTAEPKGAPKKAVKSRKELDPNELVNIKNGFHGNLIYKSKKTGEKFVWDGFGAEQDIELSELKSAKNSSKDFFINNWFLIDDPDVIEYLGFGQFYKNALNYADFEALFDKTPEEIESIIGKLSLGQKKSVVFRAKKMILDGLIDSNKVISTLQKCLGVELKGE